MKKKFKDIVVDGELEMKMRREKYQKNKASPKEDEPVTDCPTLESYKKELREKVEEMKEYSANFYHKDMRQTYNEAVNTVLKILDD